MGWVDLIRTGLEGRFIYMSLWSSLCISSSAAGEQSAGDDIVS